MAESYSKTYTHKELAALMVKDQNITEGLYDLSIEFQIAVGAVGPTPESVLPGAMVGVGKMVLTKSEKVGPNTVNAGEVNPPVKATKKPRAASKKT